MSTDLAIRPDQSSFDDAQIAALRALGVENAPVGDLDLFFHQASRLGLDPFAKQIYLIGRNTKVTEWNNGKSIERWVTKYTIQTGIDGFRVIRDRPHQHAFLGQKEEWCGPDGVWRDVWLADEPPAAARVSLQIEGYLEPIVGIARYVEYVQTVKGGDPTAMWKKMPAGQLAKCAEALALRKAYPNDLSGVYTDDEMGQADNVSGTTLIASRPGAQSNERPREIQARNDELAQEWITRIGEADSITALDRLYVDAKSTKVLQVRDHEDHTVQQWFNRRHTELEQDEHTAPDPAPAAEIEEPVLVPDYDDETPF